MKVNSQDTNYIHCNFVLVCLVFFFIQFFKKHSKLIGTENYIIWLAIIYKCESKEIWNLVTNNLLFFDC